MKNLNANCLHQKNLSTNCQSQMWMETDGRTGVTAYALSIILLIVGIKMTFYDNFSISSIHFFFWLQNSCLANMVALDPSNSIIKGI